MLTNYNDSIKLSQKTKEYRLMNNTGRKFEKSLFVDWDITYYEFTKLSFKRILYGQGFYFSIFF